MEKNKRTSTMATNPRKPPNQRDSMGRNLPKHSHTMGNPKKNFPNPLGDSSDVKGSGLSTIKKAEEVATHSLGYKKIVSFTKKF
jgi:hypothetical protein